MTEDKGSYVCCIHRNSHGSYDIYYDEVILGRLSTIYGTLTMFVPL